MRKSCEKIVTRKSKKREIIYTLLFVMALVFPRALVAETLLIANEKSDSVSVVDVATDQVIKTVPVGKTPHAIGITPDKRVAYIGNRGSNSISVIDLHSFQVVDTIKLSHTIMNLEVSPDGRYVSANSRTSLQISFVDTTNNSVIKTVVVGYWPEKNSKEKSVVNMGDPNVHAKQGGIMISHDTWSSDSNFLFVPDRYNYRVVKIAVPSFEIQDRLQLESPTHHMLITPDGKTLIALNDGVQKHGVPPNVTFIDMNSLRIQKNIAMPLSSGEFSQGHHATIDLERRILYFCNRGKNKEGKKGRTIAIIDLDKKKFINTVQAGFGAGHAALSPNGKHIFILNHFGSTITVLNAADHTMVKDIDIPLQAENPSIGHSGVFSKDGHFYFQVCETDGTLLKIDATSLNFSKTIRVGDWPSIMVRLD